PPARLLEAGNLARARESLAEFGTDDDCNLVVVGSTTPESRMHSVGNSGRQPVLEFIRWLKNTRRTLPIIVLPTTPAQPLNPFLSAFPATALIEFAADWRDALQSRVSELVACTARPARAYLDLDIKLVNADRASWRMRRCGRDPFEDSGELHVEQRYLNRLV